MLAWDAGLGLYEYMLLSEELGAEPIWVLNNGLSHQESVPTARIQGMVQDALDSIEFITGSTSTQWGGLRARMGHPQPWALTYIGVGNEVSLVSISCPIWMEAQSCRLWCRFKGAYH